MATEQRTPADPERTPDRRTATAPTGPGGGAADARGAAHFIAPVAASFFNGRLPFRLRAWDDSESGPAGAPVLHLRRPDALRRIIAEPGELGAARAYVAG